MKCDLVIISYNTSKITSECISSAISTAGEHIRRIIVVDNASSDDSVELIRKTYPNVEIIENEENLGYSKAVNIGVAVCKSEIVFISNSDIVFLPNTISYILDFFAKRPDIYLCGPRQLFQNGSPQYSYGPIPNRQTAYYNFLLIPIFSKIISKLIWTLNLEKRPKQVGYLDGGLLAVRKSAFDSVGGFDEDFFFYGEDSDFSFRMAKAGFPPVFFPKSKVIHLRGRSSQSNDYLIHSLEPTLRANVRFALKNLTIDDLRIYAKSQIFLANFKIFFSLKLKNLLKDKATELLRYNLKSKEIWKKLMIENKL